jgi:hypothetical protein
MDFSGLPITWLIGSGFGTPEDRHDDQPPVCELIITDDCIAVIH